MTIQPPDDFTFLDAGDLASDEIRLSLRSTETNDPGMNHCPCYHFDIQTISGDNLGLIRLRIGNGDKELQYLGHIGYDVIPKFRGNKYSAKAVDLITPFATRHGIETLWINCEHNNIASKKICQGLGCEFVETVEIPKNDATYADGLRLLSRYRLVIGG